MVIYPVRFGNTSNYLINIEWNCVHSAYILSTDGMDRHTFKNLLDIDLCIN